MANQILHAYPERLTKAGSHLAKLLEVEGKPVLTPFEFFKMIWRIYQKSAGEKLYLRRDEPTKKDYSRLRLNLRKTGYIGPDRDYGARVIRVLSVSDLPADNIVCLVDPTCHVSHLSAMQRWGLTDRSPEALILTRPDRRSAHVQLEERMGEMLYEGEKNPFPLKITAHPAHVRRRRIHVFETKHSGVWVQNRTDNIRVSTIGQTFLDMLQKPDLCGGMSHVLDVWERHAETHLDEVVSAVNRAKSGLVKSRAGYILEERLALKHPGVEAWKAFGQRGGSRKLDPDKEFAPTYSETWMISLNV